MWTYSKNAASLKSTYNKSVHDDPLFLSHFWLIYIHIFHFPKYLENLNSRSNMAHLPLNKLWINVINASSREMLRNQSSNLLSFC